MKCELYQYMIMMDYFFVAQLCLLLTVLTLCDYEGVKPSY